MSDKTRYNIFFITSALFSLAANFAHPVTPTILKELSLPDYMFGLALGVMMTVNFLFSPFWGKLSNYVGSKNTLGICCVGYAVGQMLLALAQTGTAVLVARSIAGIFTGGVFVGTLTYVVNVTPNSLLRGKRLTAQATVQSVFGAFGYFVGGTAGSVNPRYAVYLQAATLVMCGVLFATFCKDDSTEDFSGADTKSFVKDINPLSAFLQCKSFMSKVWAALFVVCTLQNLGFIAFDQSFNYYIKDIFDFSPAYNGILKGIMGLISLAVNSTVCVWLISKTNVKKSVVPVLGFAGAALIGVAAADKIPVFVIFAALMFAFNSVSLPMIQTLVSERSRPEQSNLVMGFYNATRSFGGIFGALLSGAFYVVNPALPFVFAATAFGVAALAATAYSKLTVKESQSTPV